MAIIGDYTPQQMRDLIIKFYPGSYTHQTFENVVLNWQTRASYSSTGNIGAAIVAVGNGPYQDEAYTYLKSCENYIIGYGQYGVQILKGRCYYGGIRDLNAYVGVWEKMVYSGTKDLGAIIGCVFVEDLPASIGIESPSDLQAYLNIFQTDTSDLSAFIHGFKEAYLPAYINCMRIFSLPALLTAVPPIDLPAYLKVWPMRQLPANVYGWDQLDLLANIYSIQKGDLPATIGGELAKDLGVILRGWVREATKDLGIYIRGFAYDDLPVTIRATYLKDLPAYLYSIAPVDITASIYGWDQLDLLAILVGVYGDYDLRASITPNNNYKNLIGILKPVAGHEIINYLPAYIKGVGSGYLRACIEANPVVNLGAYLNTIGQTANLAASIIPKVIRLTNVLSVITMEHMDLSAVINPSCIWSESRNLTAYLRTIYKSELGAVIIGEKYGTQSSNLFAKIGYADTHSFIDKLPININVATQSYRYIDILPLFISVFTHQNDLGASITGTYLYNDLSAYIVGSYLAPHHFYNVKNKQKVSKLNHSGVVEWFEMVELSFKSIVNDYFYSSSGKSAWKINRLDRWILNISSYIPQNLKLNTKRRLHKLKYMYDLKRFDSIDEAVRYAINFVTDYPEIDLTAYIKPSGGFRNIQGILNVRRIERENYNLTSSITGLPRGDVVVGFFDDGVSVI